MKHVTGYDIREPDSCTFSIAAAGATMAIQIQLLDYAGNNMATKSAIRMYYSTDADGDTVEALGAANVVATNGIIIEDLTTFSATGISEDDGTLGMTLDGDGATNTYLNIIFPDGHIQTSTVIAFNA